MAKGKSTWKYNKLLTPRRNYYEEGGSTDTDNSTSSNTKSNTKSNTNNISAGGIAGIVGTAAYDIGSMINNLTSNDVDANRKQLISEVNQAQMETPRNDSFEDLLASYSTFNPLSGVTAKQMGAKSGGSVFGEGLTAGLRGSASGLSLGPIGAIIGGVIGTTTSLIGNSERNKKIKNAANAVNNAIDYTNNFNERSFSNRADNLVTSQMANLNANYAAFGGELGTNGADFSNGIIQINKGGTHETNPLEGIPMGMDQEGTPNLVEEGETVFNDYVFSNRLKVPKAIRNKYKLRGTKPLTFAEASKQMAKESEERPNDPISKNGLQALMSDLAMAQELVKAAKRQDSMYAFGGKVNKFDGNPWTPSKINSYGYIKDGYYGMGETPFWIKDGAYTNDYQNWVRNDYDIDQFRNHIKDQFNFYDNATNAEKNSNRYKAIQHFINSNPDWYNNRGTIDTWNIDSNLMEQARGLALSKPGFMHPENAARTALSTQNTPEEASPTPPNTAVGNRYFIYGTGERINDYFEGVNTQGQTWLDLHPEYSHVYPNGVVRDPEDVDGVATTYTDYYLKKKEETPEAPINVEGLPTWMRYAPVAGFGIAAITDALGLTNKPDYSNADAILEASRKAGNYQPVSFRPVGNYLRYTPFDRDYYINKLNAESGATRRAILQNSGLNRGAGMAGILAADYNAQSQLGDLARKAEEYNLAQRQQVEDFNRATNMFNSQGFLQADIANQSARAKSQEASLRGSMAAAQLRENARLLSEEAKGANLSGLIEGIGNIGRENFAANQLLFRLLSGTDGPIKEELYSLLNKKDGKKIAKTKKK